MLVFLVAICAIAAVVVFIQVRGGGDDPVAEPRNSISGSTDSEEPEDIGLIHAEEDYRLWQRAMSQQEETGLWQFYPIIPYDVLPGETAVLSVSAIGFKGWEVDPYFADVELFDEIVDEVNAYASFIMPEEQVSIAALYTEIPYINYENQQYMQASNYEFGEAAYTPYSDPVITPIPGVPVILPDAVQGQYYNVTFNDPTTVPEGRKVIWNMNTTPPNAMPDGLTFVATPGAEFGGGYIWGYLLEGFYQFYAAFTLDNGDDFGMVMFELEVLPPIAPPGIIDTPPPAGMVEVPYTMFYIETQNMDLPNVTWAWEVVNPLNLPPGIVVGQDPNNQTRGTISGQPTTAGTYTFQVRASNPRPAVPNVTVSYTITIWEKPIITPDVPAPGAGGPTLPLLFDGIANVGSVVRDYNVTLNAAGPVASDATTIPGWTWEISPDSADPLPAGLGFSSRTNNSVAISGFPSAAETRTFTVLYKADQSVLRGWVEETYTITIQEPPYFTTAYNAPLEGMDSTQRYPGSEPADAPYRAEFSVAGFTTDLRTDWDNWSFSGDFPRISATEYMPLTSIDETFAFITGLPIAGDNLDYEFTLSIEADSTNPNINGAAVSAPFRVRIWERRYLYIDFIDARRYVRRVPGPGEAVDVNWDGDTWDDSNYRSRRAIMPGRQGEIRLPMSVTGFMRWEVTSPALAPQPNANSAARIGGAAASAGALGYFVDPGNPNTFLNIMMPSFAADGTTRVDGDVYIRGAATRQPVWTSRFNNGMVGDELSSGFVSFNDQDLGSGGDPISWQLVSGQVPPGMSFMWGNSNFLTLLSNPGGPLIDGTFTFTVGINLPGSMRVDRQFSMTIDPIPGIMLGDVNGDGQRNLADLVLLARFIRGEVDSLPNQEAGNIVSKPPARPNGSDLDILAIFFARPEASLPAPPPPAPEP